MVRMARDTTPDSGTSGAEPMSGLTLRNLRTGNGRYAVGDTGWEIRKDTDGGAPSVVCWDVFGPDGKWVGWHSTRKEALAAVRAALGMDDE